MIRVFVDEHEVPLPDFQSFGLDQIISHVEKSALKPNTVIRQIELDGKPFLPDDNWDTSGDELPTLGANGKVEIRTGTIWEVAQESTQEAAHYLARLEAASSALAKGFRNGPSAAHFAELKRLFEGFYWLNLLLDRLRSTFCIRLDSIDCSGTAAQEIYERLLGVLQSIVRAQEVRDHILIADLLEYEIAPLTPLLKTVFDQLQKKIGVAA